MQNVWHYASLQIESVSISIGTYDTRLVQLIVTASPFTGYLLYSAFHCLTANTSSFQCTKFDLNSSPILNGNHCWKDVKFEDKMYTKAFYCVLQLPFPAYTKSVHPQRIPQPLHPKKEEIHKSGIHSVSLFTFLPLLEEDEGYFMAL